MFKKKNIKNIPSHKESTSKLKEIKQILKNILSDLKVYNIAIQSINLIYSAFAGNPLVKLGLRIGSVIIATTSSVVDFFETRQAVMETGTKDVRFPRKRDDSLLIFGSLSYIAAYVIMAFGELMSNKREEINETIVRSYNHEPVQQSPLERIIGFASTFLLVFGSILTYSADKSRSHVKEAVEEKKMNKFIDIKQHFTEVQKNKSNANLLYNKVNNIAEGVEELATKINELEVDKDNKDKINEISLKLAKSKKRWNLVESYMDVNANTFKIIMSIKNKVTKSIQGLYNLDATTKYTQNILIEELKKYEQELINIIDQKSKFMTKEYYQDKAPKTNYISTTIKNRENSSHVNLIEAQAGLQPEIT